MTFQKKTVFIFLFFLMGFGMIFAHPVHVSVTTFDYKTDSGRIDFSVKMYYDDFQAYLNYKYNLMLDFSHQNRMTTKEQNSVVQYINDSFQIYDENKVRIMFTFSGWQTDENSVWLYFKSNSQYELKSVTIKNTILLDLFADQVNLVILQFDDVQKGYEFNRRNTSYTYIH